MPTFSLFLITLVAGCAVIPATKDSLPEVYLFGREVGIDQDIRQIDGVTGLDEPCMRGFDRVFEKIGVTIGYGADNRIRKIVTASPETSIAGVSPGMARDGGVRVVKEKGFTETTDGEFRRGRYRLAIIGDGEGYVRLLRLERKSSGKGEE